MRSLSAALGQQVGQGWGPAALWPGGTYLQSCRGLGMYPGYESSVIILHILLSRSEGRRVPDLTRSPRQW